MHPEPYIGLISVFENSENACTIEIDNLLLSLKLEYFGFAELHLFLNQENLKNFCVRKVKLMCSIQHDAKRSTKPFHLTETNIQYEKIILKINVKVFTTVVTLSI